MKSKYFVAMEGRKAEERVRESSSRGEDESINENIDDVESEGAGMCGMKAGEVPVLIQT